MLMINQLCALLLLTILGLCVYVCGGALECVCVCASVNAHTLVYAQILSGQRTLLGVVIWVAFSF